MAQGKKSFILYCDLISTVSKLPNEKAGELFKTILEYVNDLNPEPCDLILQIAFEPIKLQLKRDLKTWEEFRKKQAENGKLGGRPKSKSNPKNPSLILETQKSLNVTVTDTVTDIYTFDLFWNTYDKKVGRADCEKKFNKLKLEDRKRIIETLPEYIRSTPDSKYRKNPETYLNGKHWNDEIKQQSITLHREGSTLNSDGKRIVI